MNAPPLEQPHAAWAATPCIPFGGPGRRKGYGYTQFRGRQYLAHRLAFAINQGVHPGAIAGIVIRHSCDNPECINVGHLLYGTVADNTADKVSRNRQLKDEGIRQAKLTELQVLAIRAAYKPYSKDANQYTLARRFGVSQSAISLAISGGNWRHI